MKTLPRRNGDNLADTMFLRPQRPDDHREFNALLPWLTPLFVYKANGHDWVRWSIPKPVAASMGLDRGCACCGELQVIEGDSDDYLIDTAWKESDWWLHANGYALPNPTKKESTS